MASKLKSKCTNQALSALQNDPLSFLHSCQESVYNTSEPAVADQAEQPCVVPLRGGNTGSITASGEVFGKCHRLSLLRQLGHESELTVPTLLMFDGGYANEDYFVKALETVPGLNIKREEEAPIKWETENGTPVTGRPDIVLCDDADNMVLGFELKQIVSIWTARTVALQNKPKNDHLVQAAHYSWQLGVPYYLLYTSRTYFHIPHAKWFHAEADGARMVENKEGKPFRFNPFHKLFVLEWRGDELWISSDGLEPTKTVITKSGIERYYNSVAEMKEHADLGPRPVNINVFGEPEKKGPCTWCDHAELCSTEGLTLEQFIRSTTDGSKAV